MSAVASSQVVVSDTAATEAATSSTPDLTVYYTLRPISKYLLALSFGFGALGFLIAAYCLFPYVAGPIYEALWWHVNTASIALAGLSGFAGLLCVRQDQLHVPKDTGGRLHTWRVLAMSTTAAYLVGFLLLCMLLTRGAPVWYSYSAGAVGCLLAVLGLAACYWSPVGHWWELFYSMGALLAVTGGFAFWFPAIDGFYGACLFGFITLKWLLSLRQRGFPALSLPNRPLLWLIGIRQRPERRAARVHEWLYTLALIAGVAPIATLVAFRPYFEPWETPALRMFGYIMLAGTTAIYITPLCVSAALLFWCRKFQTLTIHERHNVFTQGEHFALVLFGLASNLGIAAYYAGQVHKGSLAEQSPVMLATLMLVALGLALTLLTRRRLVLFAILLPIAVAVSLKKLNYIGDFLIPLYVGNPLGY